MPSTLPDHVDVSSDTFTAVAGRHGVDSADVERLPETGIFNAIYRLGDRAILRIPGNHPKFVAASRHEAVAAPAACSAGLLTPRLLACDDSLELLPVPYTVYERVPGVPLGSLDREPAADAEVWHAHGRNLALAHLGVAVAGDVARLPRRTAEPDPRGLLAERVEAGRLSPLDADATAEARVVWRHLQLSIWTLPRGASPGLSWAERPIPMLLEVPRFLAAPPDDRWRRLGPVEPDGPIDRALVAGAGGGHA